MTMRLGFAGAGHTAAVQHARFPLAYPEDAGKRLVLSQSMPTLHEIRSKVLAPVANTAAGSVSPVIRGGDGLTCTQRDRTVRGIRDRLDSSKLSDALKLDLQQKLDSVSEKYESAKNMQESERRASGRWTDGEHENLKDLLGIPAELPEEPLAADLSENEAASNEDRSLRSLDHGMKLVSSAPAIPISQYQSPKGHRLLVQPLVLPSSSNQIGPFVNDVAQQQESMERSQSSYQRRLDKRAHTVTGGWKCTDRQRPCNMTPMQRATWSASSGLGSRGKSQATNRMVDWSVAWLEHPEDGGLAPRPRSRSPSPADDKQVNSSSAEFSRNFNVLLPPMRVLSPMLLTGIEHKKVDQNKLTPLPGSPVLRVSTSEWRLRTLFDKSLAHAVRG